MSWNIFNGGGARCPSIVEALIGMDADVVVLAETLHPRAPDLCHRLRDHGYSHQFTARRDAGTRTKGLCVLSRVALRRLAAPQPAASLAVGWLELEALDAGFTLSAIYSPAHAPAIPRFWQAVAEWAAEGARRPRLLIGDGNVGDSAQDATSGRFSGAAGFRGVLSAGFVDAWRAQHGAAREYTWHSRFKGGALRNGFRIDHALVSPGLLSRVSDCRYWHVGREQGLSDHSLLQVDLSPQRTIAGQPEQALGSGAAAS